MKHLRVRVIGSGARQCSPVRLPDGLTLEIRVEPPAEKDADWLSWSPEPESTGGALIELRGGTLVLSNLRLRADERASIESLIRVEDGDLVLDRCQFIAPPGSETKTRHLVSFEAPEHAASPASCVPGAIPGGKRSARLCACRSASCITGAVGLRAEVGRGLVALSAFRPGRRDRRDRARSRHGWPGAGSRPTCGSAACTLLSEPNLIRLGPWPGHEPRPRSAVVDHDRSVRLPRDL